MDKLYITSKSLYEFISNKTSYISILIKDIDIWILNNNKLSFIHFVITFLLINLSIGSIILAHHFYAYSEINYKKGYVSKEYEKLNNHFLILKSIEKKEALPNNEYLESLNVANDTTNNELILRWLFSLFDIKIVDMYVESSNYYIVDTSSFSESISNLIRSKLITILPLDLVSLKITRAHLSKALNKKLIIKSIDKKSIENRVISSHWIFKELILLKK